MAREKKASDVAVEITTSEYIASSRTAVEQIRTHEMALSTHFRTAMCDGRKRREWVSCAKRVFRAIVPFIVAFVVVLIIVATQCWHQCFACIFRNKLKYLEFEIELTDWFNVFSGCSALTLSLARALLKSVWPTPPWAISKNQARRSRVTIA